MSNYYAGAILGPYVIHWEPVDAMSFELEVGSRFKLTRDVPYPSVLWQIYTNGILVEEGKVSIDGDENDNYNEAAKVLLEVARSKYKIKC
jgi:hypothetical protein